LLVPMPVAGAGAQATSNQQPVTVSRWKGGDEIEAVHARHHEVDDGDREVALLHLFQPSNAVRRPRDPQRFAPQRRDEHASDGGFVLDDQDGRIDIGVD